MEIIVTFMAILELTRLKCLKLYQSSTASDIHVSVTGEMGTFDTQKIHIVSSGETPQAQGGEV